MLRGHTVSLRAPTEADVLAGQWHEWYNDYEATRFNRHGVFPMTLERELAYVKDALSDPTMVLFAIAENQSGDLIGNVSLGSVDLLNRRAEVNVMVGVREFRGTTAGLEAVGLAVEHGFQRLNLHRIWAGAHTGLSRWMRMLQAIGFRVEGRLREDTLRDGQYADVIVQGVLRDEFMELQARRGGSILCADLRSLRREVAAVTKLDDVVANYRPPNTRR